MTQQNNSHPDPLKPIQKKNKTTLWLIILVVGMFGFAYASVPLYRLFCQVTGFGGTPQIAEESNEIQGNKQLIIQFDANTDSSIQWDFKPSDKQLSVTTGENNLTFYTARNYSSKATTGMATFNVSPNKAGMYFTKMSCFCFEEQTLEAGESVQMPVSFYIDPKFDEDKDMDDVKVITLSYTFFKSEL